MSDYAKMLQDALQEDVPIVAGVGPGYAARRPQPHVYAYGTPPEEHRQPETAEMERVPLVLGANVIVRTVDGIKVAEGWIEDVMHETRVVRVRDQSSGTDVQIDVDPTRYHIEVKDMDIAGDAPQPGQRTDYTRPSAHGPHKGAMGGKP